MLNLQMECYINFRLFCVCEQLKKQNKRSTECSDRETVGNAPQLSVKFFRINQPKTWNNFPNNRK